MSKQTAKTLPSHRIYSVSSQGEKSSWTEIGAAWPHKDGNGFNLTFTARPLEGAQIVLREPKKDDAKPKSSHRTSGRYDELHTTSVEGGAQ